MPKLKTRRMVINPRTWPFWAWAIIAGLATSGVAIWIGSYQSVWFDEAFSIMIAHEPLGKFFHHVALDTQPPLYYLILKFWMALLGDSDFVLRLLSAIFGGLTSFFALLLAGRIFGKKIAYFCLPFVILAPLLVRYNFEIRMYALAALWCVLGSYLLVRALEAKSIRLQKRWWAGYGLIVLAGVFTFYYCAFVWIGHSIWLSLRRLAVKKHEELAIPSDKNRGFLARRPWLVVYAVCLIIFAAWIPVVIHQVSSVQGHFWISPVSYYKVVDLFAVIASYTPAWLVGSWQSVFIFGGILVAIWLVVATFHQETRLRRWYFGFLGLYFLLPIGLMYLISLPPAQPVFLERYTTQAAMGGYLLAGVAVGLIWLRHRPLVYKVASLLPLAVLIYGVVQVATVGNYNLERLYKPDAKSIATYLDSQIGNSGNVLVGGPGKFMIYSHYLPTDNLRFIHKDTILNSGVYAMLAGNRDQVRAANELPAGAIWYVYAGNSLHQPPILAGYHLVKQVSFAQDGVALYKSF